MASSSSEYSEESGSESSASLLFNSESDALGTQESYQAGVIQPYRYEPDASESNDISKDEDSHDESRCGNTEW